MSGSLLKSAGWFLRPPHLKKPLETDLLPSPNVTPPVRPVQPLVPPEEEFFIRRCCPVTLSHLLPDLYLTQKQQIDNASSEFDANLKIKLEKHFEESHSVLSCTNSSENEEEDEEENEEEMEGEKELEESIENDINLHILHKEKFKFPNKQLLKPHVVNYPEPDMEESILPGVTLNNKYALTFKNQIHTKSFHGVKNIEEIPPSNIIDFQLVDGDFQKMMVPYKNNRQIRPLLKNKSVSFSTNKRWKTSTKRQFGEPNNQFNINSLSIFPKTESNFSFLSPRSAEETSKHLTTHLSLTPQYASPFHKSTPALCLHHRRAKSLPPFKTKLPGRTHSPTLPETPDNNLIMPSPHLLQLAELKREELQLKEKILLRQRQILELERLKSPVEKWYEMKNYRFHQEAHRNNAFLKNENNLPLIRERRQQLYDVVMNSH